MFQSIRRKGMQRLTFAWITNLLRKNPVGENFYSNVVEGMSESHPSLWKNRVVNQLGKVSQGERAMDKTSHSDTD